MVTDWFVSGLGWYLSVPTALVSTRTPSTTTAQLMVVKYLHATIIKTLTQIQNPGLQNYDGLGSLGLIKLGGISGTIQQPIATIYSNADSSALGLGYQNTGGYIEGSGLSYKAAQALQNAGLLKVNNGVVYQAGGREYQNQEYDLQGGYVGLGGSAGNVDDGTLQKLSGGVAGSVNIIGGGYSAVGKCHVKKLT